MQVTSDFRTDYKSMDSAGTAPGLPGAFLQSVSRLKPDDKPLSPEI